MLPISTLSDFDSHIFSYGMIRLMWFEEECFAGQNVILYSPNLNDYEAHRHLPASVAVRHRWEDVLAELERRHGDTSNLSAPLIVKQPTIRNDVWLFTKIPYGRWYLNSLFVTLSTTLFSPVVSVMAGCAILRLRFSGAAVIGVLIFITYLIPKTKNLQGGVLRHLVPF